MQRIVFDTKCNTSRMRKDNEGENTKRLQKVSSEVNHTLYGWAQTTHSDYHESPLYVANTKRRCMISSFSRDVLFQ